MNLSNRVTNKIIGLILVASLFSCAGQQLTSTQKGLGAGTLIGSGLGAIVGHETGNTGAGIAIGAATGAIAGGLIGNTQEGTQNRQTEQEERMRRQEEELRRQRYELEELRRREGGRDLPPPRDSYNDGYRDRYDNRY